MRIDGFTKSLVFGAGAAITAVFALHVAAPWTGTIEAVRLYLVGCTIAYASLLGGTPRRALRNALAAGIGAGVVLLVSGGIPSLAVGLTGVLALVRSGLEASMRPARAVAVETLLGLFALGLASWIAFPGWLGSAAALWGYVLAQSLYFLVPGRGWARRSPESGDPFECARQRLTGLLGDG